MSCTENILLFCILVLCLLFISVFLSLFIVIYFVICCFLSLFFWRDILPQGLLTDSLPGWEVWAVTRVVYRWPKTDHSNQNGQLPFGTHRLNNFSLSRPPSLFIHSMRKKKNCKDCCSSICLWSFPNSSEYTFFKINK